MTDAPIYLVSACGSGEEFVAAFRRYADKHGLFVPIAEPLASGKRARFAVTLRDGGVMIEGEAEIVSSARSASVLHGRVGMTLKFVEPDAPSKTMLGELEKARLSMRPPPPSVAPRPASLPAEPRPVPPAPAGRIDAVNALAECVAIAPAAQLEALALGEGAVKAATKLGMPPLADGRAKPTTAAPPRAMATEIGTPIAKPAIRPPTLQVPAIKPAVAIPPTAQVPAIKPGTGPLPSIKSGTGPVPAIKPTLQVPAIKSIKPVPRAEPSEPLADDPNEPSVTDVAVLSDVTTSLIEPTTDTPDTTDTPETPDTPDTPDTEDVPLHDAGASRAVDGADADRTAAAPVVAGVEPVVERGPTSETMIIAGPPEPEAPSTDPGMTPLELPSFPRVGTRPGMAPLEVPSLARTSTRPGNPPPPLNLSAVPLPAAASSSAPTDIGGALLVDPSLGEDRLALEASPVSDATAPVSAIVEATAEADDASARTQVHAGVPPREPTSGPREPARPSAAQLHAQQSFSIPGAADGRGSPIDLTATLRSPPPEMEEVRALLASDRRPRPGERMPEVEIAEPTDLSTVPPPPVQTPPSHAVLPSPAQLANETPSQRTRRTAVGVAVIPAATAEPEPSAMEGLPTNVAGSISAPAVSIAPAAPAASNDGASSSVPVPRPLGVEPPVQAASVIVDESSYVGEEPTGADRVVEPETDGKPDGKLDGKADAKVEEPTPSEYWTISPDGQLASKPKDHRARSNSSGPIAQLEEPRTRSGRTTQPPASGPVAAPARSARPTPEPRAARPTPQPAPGFIAAPGPAQGARADKATLLGTGPIARPSDGAAQPVAVEHSGPLANPPVGPATGLPAGDWTIALDPGAPDGWSEPFETVPPLDDDPAGTGEPPARPSLRPHELPVAEPKVQIDPTLIEPAPALEPYARPSAPVMPMPTYTGGGGGFSSMATPMPMPMAMPPTPAPYGTHVSAYPVDPAYQMVPVASLPRPPTADAFGYASDPALPAQPNSKRRIIIVVATAIVVVLIGIFVLARLTKHDDKERAPGSEAETTEVQPAPAHVKSAVTATPPDPAAHADPSARPATAATTHADPATHAAPAAAHTDTPAPEARPAPAAGGCFADVTSSPAGAEIVLGSDNVLGTTPSKVALPCGDKVELTIRKTRMMPAYRTVTPTPEGAPVRVALGKQLVQVKVSSTPPGATITLAGKPLGVTPTTIKVPAYEASTLAISKDGYVVESEKVAPRSNGTAVHTNLKKLDRRPR